MNLNFKPSEKRKKLNIDFASRLYKNTSPLTNSFDALSLRQTAFVTGKLKLSPEISYEFKIEDLKDLGEIGRGSYGAVNKMLHKKSSTYLAVKRIRCSMNEKEQSQILMDLEVVLKSNDCPYIVQFYGAMFKEGDCWICMQLMDTCLDKFYKHVYNTAQSYIPEHIISKITYDTLQALNYLKESLNIIHRDIKPSNILLNVEGQVKLCDFGIAGRLVDSIAKTRDAGCQPYMAPERIDPTFPSSGYGVRSDVWSLGITLIEVCQGTFPYPKWSSVFEQLAQIVHGPAPQLKNCKTLDKSNDTNCTSNGFSPQDTNSITPVNEKANIPVFTKASPCNNFIDKKTSDTYHKSCFSYAEQNINHSVIINENTKPPLNLSQNPENTSVSDTDKENKDCMQRSAFSDEIIDFVNKCLIKDEAKRPKYNTLLKHDFIIQHMKDHCKAALYFKPIIESMVLANSNNKSEYTSHQTPSPNF